MLTELSKLLGSLPFFDYQQPHSIYLMRNSNSAPKFHTLPHHQYSNVVHGGFAMWMTMFSQSGTEKVTQCRNLDSFLRIPTPPPPPVPAPSSAMLPEDLEVSPLIMIVSPSKHDGPRMEILAPEQVTSGPSGWTKSVEQKYLLNNC